MGTNDWKTRIMYRPKQKPSPQPDMIDLKGQDAAQLAPIKPLAEAVEEYRRTRDAANALSAAIINPLHWKREHQIA